jgi:hypothetical protein
MASERAIALIRAGAVERLEKAASTLAKRLDGVEGLNAPLSTIRGFGDIELAHARQLEALADVLDDVVKAVKVQQEGYQAQLGQLERDYADAQTQLLTLKKNEPAAPADDTNTTTPTTPKLEPAKSDKGNK